MPYEIDRSTPGKSKVVDRERAIVLRNEGSGPNAPWRFNLDVGDCHITFDAQLREKRVPGEKMDIVWTIGNMRISRGAEGRKEEFHQIILAALPVYGFFGNQEKVKSVTINFVDGPVCH